MSRSFQSAGLSPPWLNLFQEIFSYDAIVNGVVFLIPYSLSDSLLSVYINTKYFCILTLYTTSLVNLLVLVDLVCLCVKSLSLLHIVSCHLQITSFSSFQVRCLFFSCLSSLGRASNTMLNKINRNGHAYLVLNLRGTLFSFSPLNMILALNL